MTPLYQTTYLKNDDFARIQVTSVFWAVFPVVKNEVIANVEQRLLDLIRKRVEENKQNKHSSIIRLLVNIFGLNFDGKAKSVIQEYFEQEFKGYYAQKIIDGTYSESKFLPKGYKAERQTKSILDLNGRVMYQLP